MPIKSDASSFPSYSTDENGEIVVDGEFSEDGEKTTYDEPVTVEEFEKIEGDDYSGIDDSSLPDETIKPVSLPDSESLENVKTPPSDVSLSDAAPAAIIPICNDSTVRG